MGNSQETYVKQQSNSNRASLHKQKSFSKKRLSLPSIRDDKSTSRLSISNSVLTPMTPITPKRRHFKDTSQDFNASASELYANLPEDLKAYSNSIEVMYRFWCSEIETLDQDKFKETAVLFYLNIFQKIPSVRKLFRKNIEMQSKQFFGMFRWIVANLKQPDAGRLIKSIKILGELHREMHIKEQWYTSFLDAFHETMVEITQEKYTSRTRFCMEQLYTLVTNIMLGNDFESLSSAKISQFIKSLGNLNDCLNDKEGAQYLEMYMRQQFCVEHILFYKDYRRYAASVNATQRKIIGTYIMSKYLDDIAECEINVSYDCKQMVYRTLSSNKEVFNEGLFDECCKQTVSLIRNNIWSGFKKSIFKMTVDADINYEANASSRSLKRYINTPIVKIQPNEAMSASMQQLH